MKDRRHGKGKYTFAEEKGVYEGFWSKNKSNGKGKLVTKAGDTYEGAFSKGIQEGKGIYTSADLRDKWDQNGMPMRKYEVAKPENKVKTVKKTVLDAKKNT